MNKSLWKVVVVVAAFLGFMVGYSIPPMVEVGIFSSDGVARVQDTVDEEMQEYYENLLKEK